MRKHHATNLANSNASEKHIQSMSYTKLSFICDLSPLNVFLEVIPSDSGFMETIERPTMSNDTITLTLKICKTILSLPLHEHTRCFAEQITAVSNYWKNIAQFVKTILDATSPTEDKTSKKKKNMKSLTTVSFSCDQCVEIIRNICIILEALLRRQQTIDDKIVESLLNHLHKGKYESQLKPFVDKLDKLRTAAQEHQSSTTSKHKHIYPKLCELLSTEPVVMHPNIIHGRYKDVADYLDTQLGMLREDFILPLREGIAKFRQTSNPTDIRSFRYYERVKITTPLEAGLLDSATNKQMIVLDLGRGGGLERKYKRNSEEMSTKDLMYGSLLLLTTKVLFDDLVVAVISNCDADLLSQGYVSEVYGIFQITKKCFVFYNIAIAGTN